MAYEVFWRKMWHVSAYLLVCNGSIQCNDTLYLTWRRLVVYCLQLKSYINWSTQTCRRNMLVLCSTLLHVSAVYISHQLVGISSQ